MLGPSYPFKGGISRYTTDLFRSLKKEHEVVFYTFKRQYPGFLYPGKSDIDLSDTSLRDPDAVAMFDSLNPFSWWKTAKKIKDFEPEVLLLPWWVAYWGLPFAAIIAMVRRARSGTRVLFLCHNVISHESSRLSELITRKVLSMADAFLVHSEQDREQLRQLLGGQPRVELAEHPVYEVDLTQTKAAARYSLKVDGPVLLFFGFVRPYKGLEVLIKAMPAAIKQVECTLLVAGEFWQDLAEYQSLVNELGLETHVRFDDRYITKTDLADYFLASDIVVLPYLSATGSGIAKLAFSYGRPVIVTDTGALPATVEEGINGYIVPPGCPRSLADAITGHFNSDRQEEMEQSALRLGGQYSWDNVIKRIEALTG